VLPADQKPLEVAEPSEALFHFFDFIVFLFDIDNPRFVRRRVVPDSISTSPGDAKARNAHPSSHAVAARPTTRNHHTPDPARRSPGAIAEPLKRLA
jgi:hypothetical protein